MNYSKIRNDISILEHAIQSTRSLAAREGRSLDAKEREDEKKLQAKVDDLQADLPAHAPLSRPGSHLGGGTRALSGHSGGGYSSLGEQAQAIIRAGAPGAQVDQRLYDIRAAASGLNESVPSEAGFLVQPDYAKEILTSVFQTSLLADRCRRIQISGNSNSIKINGVDETSRVSGSRHGGIVGYWVGEAAEITKSKPSFRQMELLLRKLAALVWLTDELVEDASALDGFLRAAVPSEFGFLLDDGIIRGNGAGEGFLGILNSGSLVTVAAESGQSAAAGIVTENVVKMYSRLLPGSERTAIWLVNKNVFPSLYTMSLAVGVGGSAGIFAPAGGLSASPHNTLLGLPVIAVEQASSVGTVGDVILTDLANGYIIADKGGIQSAASIHVRFEFDEQVLRWTYRCSGQPTLASSIVPYKGSLALSHHIALATRS